jgi:hypothetical protein
MILEVTLQTLFGSVISKPGGAQLKRRRALSDTSVGSYITLNGRGCGLRVQTPI